MAQITAAAILAVVLTQSIISCAAQDGQLYFESINLLIFEAVGNV